MYHPRHKYHWYNDTEAVESFVENLKVFICGTLFAGFFGFMVFAWLMCWI